LRNLTEFTTTESISEEAKMTKLEVTQCISKARILLAGEGVIIINRHGEGYRVGNADEFVVEVDKACKRALAQATGMAKIISALKRSGKIKENLDDLEGIIKKNIDGIAVIFEMPEYENYKSYEEFKDDVEMHFDRSRIHSERLKEISEEIIPID